MRKNFQRDGRSTASGLGEVGEAWIRDSREDQELVY